MTYKEIDPEDASQRISKEDNLLLLDVREPDEYEEVHIDGVKLIPLGQLEARLSELDPEQPILCICAAGGRSERAARLLLANNFCDVTNLCGGMRDWQKCGLPSICKP